jgi:hypothetical protein
MSKIQRILHADYIALMCFLLISEQTANFALYSTNRLVFRTEVDSVDCAVRTEFLYNTDTFRPLPVPVAARSKA